MAGQVSPLEQRKRELLARSQLCREGMEAELRNIQTATAWVPKAIKIARSVYPVLMLAAPLLGYGFARKKRFVETAPKKLGILSTALAGFQLFRKVKPVWDGFRDYRNR
jgi:hypothetical protein